MLKNNFLIAVVPLILLVGCETTPVAPVVQTVIQRVEVPIAVPCKVEVPAKPDFSFDKLLEEQSIFDKAKAILADRLLHESYEAELNTALNSCIK